MTLSFILRGLRNRLFLKIAILFFLLFCQQVGATEPPRSYPLVCRGGGAMRYTYHVVRLWGGGAKTADYTSTIDFAKATHAATSRAPEPGHCAWVDRPLTAEEPARLSIGNLSSYRFDIEISIHGMTLYSSGEGAMNNAFFNSFRFGGLIYLQCHNTNRGYLNCGMTLSP